MKEKQNDKAVDLKFSSPEPCRMKAEISFPAEDVDSNLEIAFKEMRKTIAIPGFRRGKAPVQMIRKRFEGAALEQIVRNFTIDAFDRIREKFGSDLMTLPSPENELPQPELGKPYSFTLTFDVAPEIKLPDYKGIKLEQAAEEVTDEDIEEELNRYRDVYSEFSTVDSPAEEGDMLKVSFKSDIQADDDTPESAKRLIAAEDTWCWLNEPEMMPGIIKGLTGVKPGKTKDLEIVFPADYSDEYLAGKKGNYEFTVNEVQRRVPLKDDEELCRRLNVDDIDALKERIRNTRTETARHQAEMQLRNQALDSLAEKIGKFDLPPAVLASAVQTQLRQIANGSVKTQEDAEAFRKDIETHRKTAEEQAGKRLATYFIAKKIAEAEKLEVGQSEIDDRIRGLSMAYGYKEKDLRQHMESSGGMEELHIDLTIEKVADFLVKNADIKEKSGGTKKTSAKKKSDKKNDAEKNDKKS